MIRRATVTQASPLRVRVDGATSSTAADGTGALNQRVLVDTIGTTLVVVGGDSDHAGLALVTGPFRATSVQSGAAIGNRTGGNSFEWGHPNGAGYGSTLGAESGGGAPFIALRAEAGTDANTYRTRGFAGVVLISDGASTLHISKVPAANADNQALTTLLTIEQSGRVGFLSSVDTVASTAGSVASYLRVLVGGTERRIPLHNP